MFIHRGSSKAQKNNEVIYRASAKRKEQDIMHLLNRQILMMHAK